jgi:hypothetical protein
VDADRETGWLGLRFWWPTPGEKSPPSRLLSGAEDDMTDEDGRELPPFEPSARRIVAV